MDRTLALHISALSPDEYDLYPAVLRELAGPGQDDDSWDRPVDVMEARGWIRGRYGLEAAIVDKILRYFPTTPGRADMLSAGQFFAVMRLVAHTQSGREPAKTLVFVQANVPSASEGHAPGTQQKHSFNTSQKFSSSKATQSPSQPPLTRPRGPSDATVHPNEESSNGPTPNQPKKGNPFRRSASVTSAPSPFIVPVAPDEPLPAPPMHPMSRLSTAAIETMSSSRSEPSELTYSNPFGQRLSTGIKSSGTSPSTIPQLPPLPPRRPPNLPPRVVTNSFVVANSPPPTRPPKIFPKPTNLTATPIATSQLMKESLKAAKGGQIQKANDALLGKTLNLEVIGSSRPKDPGGNVSPFGLPVTLSSSSSTNLLLKSALRRSPSPSRKGTVPTPPESVMSFEHIAAARVSNAKSSAGLDIKNGGASPSSTSSASSSSTSPNVHVPALTQPSSLGLHSVNEAYIDQDYPILSTNSSSPGVMGRSRSLHSTPSPNTRLPPPPRRRPESIQVLGTNGSPFSQTLQPDIGSPLPPVITRHASLHSHSHSRSGLNHPPPPPPQSTDTFQSLYESVRKKADPIHHSVTDGFEVVLKKAESKLVPGGFVRRGAGVEGRRLFDDPESDVQESSADERALSVDSLGVDEPNVDDNEWRELDRGREEGAMAEGWRRL